MFLSSCCTVANVSFSFFTLEQTDKGHAAASEGQDSWRDHFSNYEAQHLVYGCRTSRFQVLFNFVYIATVNQDYLQMLYRNQEVDFQTSNSVQPNREKP